MDKLVYWEIRSMDIDATSTFFAQLFGWRMQKTSDNYVMIEVERGISGGIQHIDADPGQGLAVYIGVDDIPATLERAEELGGTILHPKTEIGGDWGFWADFRPPGGCPAIGLWSKT